MKNNLKPTRTFGYPHGLIRIYNRKDLIDAEKINVSVKVYNYIEEFIDSMSNYVFFRLTPRILTK
jgi:hypothetical protein